MFAGKKILITGGAGFIGSNLCEYFLGKGARVVCLDNLSTGKKENMQTFLKNNDFQFIEGDIRDYNTCLQSAEGCKFVLHQAALGSVPRSIKDPMTTTEVNITGFVNILNASVESGVQRFIYAASSSTYGDHTGLPKVEHKIGNALSPYAITKFADELFAANFSDIYGIETIGLRYFNVFGRRQSPDGAYAAVIPKFCSLLIDKKSPIINGDGSNSRDFTYIDNVLHANEQACLVDTDTWLQKLAAYHRYMDLNVPIRKSDVFNVACGQATNLAQLVDYLKQSLSHYDQAIADVEPTYGPNRQGDIPHSLASVEKGAEVYGYLPKYSVKEGLKLATAWYWNNLDQL